MTAGKVHIKVYASKENRLQLGSLFHQLELDENRYVVVKGKEYNSSKNEISLFIIDSLESHLLNKLLENKEEFLGLVCIVFTKLDALMVSSLARFGFQNIFILPFEQYKLKDFLEEGVIFLYTEMFKEQSVNKYRNEYIENWLVGNSPAFVRVLEMAKKIAANKNVSILITGETGTGKGLIAKAIHMLGSDASAPFVDLHCSAIPDTLLESELFGYEKGAFTDAKFRKQGLFEIAHNGTLFLDEVGEISLSIQAKLLQAIDKKVMRRLGGVSDITISSRFISATHRNLEAMIKEKLFREDLFHRLNVFPLHIPPLRERGKDIILLADFFLSELSEKNNKEKVLLSREAEELLYSYHWPGNVRELHNAIERAIMLNNEDILLAEHFGFLKELQSSIISNIDQQAETDLFVEELEVMIKSRVKKILERTGGNKTLTAKMLGISRPRLDRIIND